MDNDHSSQLLDKEDYTSSLPFVRALMTALFAGIADTILCLMYNLIYRDSGRFFPTDFIYVSTIFF